MGAFVGCMFIVIALVVIGIIACEELFKIRKALETIAQPKEVDSERCKCQICDGQVPTMKERRDG